jgi:hypothetical protein
MCGTTLMFGLANWPFATSSVDFGVQLQPEVFRKWATVVCFQVLCFASAFAFIISAAVICCNITPLSNTSDSSFRLLA